MDLESQLQPSVLRQQGSYASKELMEGFGRRLERETQEGIQTNLVEAVATLSRQASIHPT